MRNGLTGGDVTRLKMTAPLDLSVVTDLEISLRSPGRLRDVPNASSLIVKAQIADSPVHRNRLESATVKERQKSSDLSHRPRTVV